MPSSTHGTLYVVATPIGNLKDITERARSVLGLVEGVLCEDTRRGAQLLRGLGLEMRPTHRLDAHTTEYSISGWVDRLVAGDHLALVSDAGTPGVSDPGARLVLAARNAGIAVIPVPGASAVAAMVSVLGAASESEEQQAGFEFVGFLPRSGASQLWMKWLKAVQGREVKRIIAFESPHRIVSVLKEIATTLIPPQFSSVSIRCVVAKELTKVHERIWEGGLHQILKDVEAEISREGALGEWCVAWIFHTTGPDLAQGQVIPQEEQTITLPWSRWLEILLELDVPVSRAVATVCQEFGAAKNAVYARALAFEKLDDKKNPTGG